jgi:para-aminobenzoate synthetase component 1
MTATELCTAFATHFRDEPACMIMQSNDHRNDPYHQYETVMAAGSVDSITIQSEHDFPVLDAFIQRHSGEWVMGHITYEFLHLLEEIPHNEDSFISLPVLHFFVPHTVIESDDTGNTKVHKCIGDPETLTNQLNRVKNITTNSDTNLTFKQSGITKDRYLSQVKKLLQEIHLGNIYEINYCHEIRLENFNVDPYHFYNLLNTQSQSPFAAWYRQDHTHLFCASPERFVARRGEKLICQPIKGTNRKMQDPIGNQHQIEKLQHDEKERAENIMIVDLIRNDLSRICTPGTVQVEELCGVYPFRFVNQMISTITGHLRSEMQMSDILKALFPAGSMTGAPKVSAMQLISRYEQGQRGLYSGTIGYCDPQGNWDFNVIIRSMIYDSVNRKASISAGGAITALSDSEAEYEESLLKLESLLDLIQMFQTKSKA